MTGQEPLDSVIELTAAGWKKKCMSNGCVVDLVRCKQKNMVSEMMPFLIFNSKQARAIHISERFSTQHTALGGPHLKELNAPDASYCGYFRGIGSKKKVQHLKQCLPEAVLFC